MHFYQIAEIHVGVSWENEKERVRCYHYHDCIILPRSMAAFYPEAVAEEPDMNVRVCGLNEFTGAAYCKRIYNHAFFDRPDQHIMMVYDPNHLTTPGYSIEMSKDYSQVKFLPHIREYEHYDLQWMMYPFEGRLLYKGGVVLHGAAVEYKGNGFIFTGISGAGKTTQAHLWQSYRNAIILNGDCPALRMKDGIPYVYGTPWCGTSGEFINRRAHLSAVILVKQGVSNSIRELTGTTAILAVLANVLHSSFDQALFDLSIENLKEIIQHIRVFELTCTISEEAVKILEEEML